MPSILDLPGNAWCRHPVEQVGLLVDARDYYREFYRAALGAQRYVLLSGWQFDSEVELLRGADAERAQAPVQLLKFLNHLCETRPELQILILAWDFHPVFAIEREWMQSLLFDWNTSSRLRFKFDGHHVENGSHHQKFVVIDDELAFLGGIDLCDHRWDDRQHQNDNPLRMSRGAPHRPFHDVQVRIQSAGVAASITQLFLRRWELAGGGPVELPEGGDRADRATQPRDVPGLLPIASGQVALSRTDPYGSPEAGQPRFEIRDQYLRALELAQRLIYIETQYFSSHVIGEALMGRMRDASKSRLEIVLVINMKGETLKEQAAVGLAQAELIGRMRQTAAETGHALGIYYTLPDCNAEDHVKHTTYIHSKLMIVDDRFLIVGSANLTNRSMAVDTELNASVEDGDDRGAIGGSLRGLRANLLAEHTGGPEIDRVEGLVAELEALAAQQAPLACRLRRHQSPTPDEQTFLSVIDPQKLPFDPDSFEEFDQDKTFSQGIRRLFQSLGGK